jgi:hypothetical protein
MKTNQSLDFNDLSSVLEIRSRRIEARRPANLSPVMAAGGVGKGYDVSSDPHPGSFKSKQPGLCTEAAKSAIAMKFSVRANQAMTWDDQGHGIAGISPADSACGARTAHLVGNLTVSPRLAVGDRKDELERAPLKV